jgi:hypothetical protein
MRRRRKVLHLMVPSITRIQSSLNFLWIEFWFVTVVPKYLDCDTFQMMCLLYLSICIFLYSIYVLFSGTFLLEYSKAALKTSGNRAAPCFRPFWIGKLSDKCLPIRTLLYVSFKHILINLTSFMGTKTLWEYCTILPSSLNHRISCSLWIADVLSRCPPIFSPASDECR